jgi:hypothetical protein
LWFCRLKGFKYFVGKTNTSGHGPHPLRINTNVAMIRDFICSLKPLWSYPLQCFQVHLSKKIINFIFSGSAGSLGSACTAVPIENDENWDVTGEDETGEEECRETDPIIEPEDSNLCAIM